MQRPALRLTLPVLVTSLLLVACGAALACGAGEGGINGIGNSGNRVFLAGVTDELVEALAENPAVPPISDAMLQRTFDALLERAHAGELEAALLVFRVAERQGAKEAGQ